MPKQAMVYTSLSRSFSSVFGYSRTPVPVRYLLRSSIRPDPDLGLSSETDTTTYDVANEAREHMRVYIDGVD